MAGTYHPNKLTQTTGAYTPEKTMATIIQSLCDLPIWPNTLSVPHVHKTEGFSNTINGKCMQIDKSRTSLKLSGPLRHPRSPREQSNAEGPQQELFTAASTSQLTAPISNPRGTCLTRSTAFRSPCGSTAPEATWPLPTKGTKWIWQTTHSCSPLLCCERANPCVTAKSSKRGVAPQDPYNARTQSAAVHPWMESHQHGAIDVTNTARTGLTRSQIHNEQAINIGVTMHIIASQRSTHNNHFNHIPPSTPLSTANPPPFLPPPTNTQPSHHSCTAAETVGSLLGPHAGPHHVFNFLSSPTKPTIGRYLK